MAVSLNNTQIVRRRGGSFLPWELRNPPITHGVLGTMHLSLPSCNCSFALPDVLNVFRSAILGHHVGDEDALVTIRSAGIAVQPSLYAAFLLLEVNSAILHGDIEAKRDPHFRF